MNLTNYFCPVCNKAFEENDDVVFCPECGTPHHRLCWAENGKCKNEDLHGTGENIEATFTNAVSENNQVEVEEKPAENTVNGDFSADFQNPYRIEINADTLINGKPAYLYEIALKKNQKYYIPRFILEDKGIKAPSWNFVAFLVPMAWSLYRKMYKLSAIIFAIYIAVFSVTSYFIISNDAYLDASVACMEEDPEFLKKIYMYEAGEEVILTQKQQQFINISESIEIPKYISTGSTIILYLMRFFVGINGNKIYLKKITKTIKNAENKGLTADSLKFYVFRKNGVLPIIIAVFVGIFEWFII